jgi:hypothetical protein
MVEFCYFSISVLHICSYLHGVNCPGWLVELCDFSTSVYCTFVSNCEGVNCPGWLVELRDFSTVVAHCMTFIYMANQLSFVNFLPVFCTFVANYMGLMAPAGWFSCVIFLQVCCTFVAHCMVFIWVIS